MKSIYKITLVLLLLPLIASANPIKKKHEKNRVIKKEFSVNADAKVALNNRYGNLNITTWNKNKVEIEVTITVKGNDLDAVEDRLSSIDVMFNATKSLVEAETIFEKNKSSWSWWKKSRNINYKINYVVKMPKSNAVDLDNDYGNIYLGDLDGKADINCDYGKISVGDLTASNNNINLDYCSTSSIAFMKSGSLNVDYSKITIDKTESVKVNADYSGVKLGEVQNVDFNADYGSISIDAADNVQGNSDYASMRFGTIKKNLNIDTDYGSLSVKNLARGFQSVDIDGQYAGIRIGIDPNAVFNFEIDLQYAGFSRNNDKMEFFKSISKSTKKYYQGKYGKGNTNSKIRIKSQYGGVSIKEN
ncbi:hypothetical protein [Polaribacter aquimarinus]|uniref:Adhesin domain-containing protein n=1 Tax=Polaribacter aquimarinus TaxID=2100726 RepID=A0A2U2JAY7_9FLAO|nr:hypothetical protein [Polaribacter aquimarinus]PWG05441.1 hypothetical protein DIS07_09440 [Polaribacter aquimarinus]